MTNKRKEQPKRPSRAGKTSIKLDADQRNAIDRITASLTRGGIYGVSKSLVVGTAISVAMRSQKAWHQAIRDEVMKRLSL